MLVLTRKTGEVLRIGSDITVTITETARGKCRVAIEAPREMPIWRGEIYDRIEDQQNRERPAG